VSLAATHNVGPYEVLALVGAGGMGEVYRAHDPRLDRSVAIKILPESFARDEGRLRRFHQEARILAGLNHPNIVAVFDVGSHEGKPYLVTEFLAGETLRERLNRGNLPVRKAIAYAGEIAEALSAAHGNGIVHRDLKPENIFITSAGRVKVLDFGLARSTVASVGSGGQSPTIVTTSPTQPGAVMGTAGYMSPEQVRGEQVDHRSDIFSFGAVLYEMLTGKRAFQRASSVETMNAILKEEPPEILPERPDVAPGLERILRHCLEKEPERRFESARDLAFDLVSLSGSSDSFSKQAPPQNRRQGLKIAAAFVAGAIVLVAIAFLAWPSRRTPERRFQKLTFQRGYVYNARFAPDRKTVLYSASWSGNQPAVFSTIPGTQDSRALGIENAELLAVSSNGELAVLLHPTPDQAGFLRVGTLARVNVSAGTAPRELAEDVDGADWTPDGKNLGILRLDRNANTDIVEYPVGRAIYHSTRPDWLSHVRVSPRGDQIALLQHTGQGDDRGRLIVLDTEGKVRFRSDLWAGISGVAWASNSTLRLAATTPQSIARQLYSVDLTGKQRIVLEIPGEMTLQDIGPDGSALLTTNDRRILIQSVNDGKWRDLSWLDRSIFDTISSDGTKILFHEGGQGGGILGATYLRGIDGSPPVRLSEGYGIDLSPDQKWALVWLPFVPPQYRLVPTGVGDPLPVATPAINSPAPVGFARNRTALFWVGRTGANERQLFETKLDGTNPRPVLPAGTLGLLVSRNGKYGVYRTPAGLETWDAVANVHQALPQMSPGDIALAMSDDGEWLTLARPTPAPALKVWRVNLRTGSSETMADIAANDLTGMAALLRVSITPDGKTIVLSYVRHLSDLYLMKQQ
jgi:serine/threonine protein kinase